MKITGDSIVIVSLSIYAGFDPLDWQENYPSMQISLLVDGGKVDIKLPSNLETAQKLSEIHRDGKVVTELTI